MTTLFQNPAALPVAIITALIYLALASFAYFGLRYVVLSIRSWLTAEERAAEKAAVDAVVRYQGPYHFERSGKVRERFARRLSLRFHNHWACAGKWVPWD